MPYVNMRTEIIVTPGESPKRLDHFLANRDPDFSRTMLQRLILGGHITVNGQSSKPSHTIKPGNRIVLTVPRPEPVDIGPEPIPIEILYEDEVLLVINKQAGLVVHPAPGHWSGTLVNALLHHLQTTEGSLSQIGGQERPGLVHRLDKDTTGVMVIAKQDQAHTNLARQFKQHSIARTYEAFIVGAPRRDEGTIELAIGRDCKERKKISARTARPKASATVYRVTERFGTMASAVNLFPKTGRTHQLRVHLSTIGCPILGDPTYGGQRVLSCETMPIPRVMLHAKMLGFVHPLTQQEILFSAPRPADMQTTIQHLRECMDSQKRTNTEEA